MTNVDLPLKATLKAGTGYDAPWLTVDGATPDDLEFKLKALGEGGALQALVDAANHLKALNVVAPVGSHVEPAPQQQAQQGGWAPSVQPAPSWSGAQQQAAPPQQGGAKFHPEGKTCKCGNVLNFKQVNRRSDGKQFSFWECPARTGSKDTNHDSEFAN